MQDYLAEVQLAHSALYHQVLLVEVVSEVAPVAAAEVSTLMIGHNPLNRMLAA